MFSKLNGRLIIVHLAAYWLFYYAFQTFAFLYDRGFFNPRYTAVFQAQFPERYKLDVTIIQQAGNIGLLVVYVISWFIASKRGWHWINDVLVFIIAFALGNLEWFGWDHLSPVFLAIGNSFTNSIARFVSNGAIMVALGCLLLFSKSILRFIDRGQSDYKAKLATDKIARRVK